MVWRQARWAIVAIIALICMMAMLSVSATLPQVAYAQAGESQTVQVKAASVASDDATAQENSDSQAEQVAAPATVKDGLYVLKSVEESGYSVSVKGDSAKAKALVQPAKTRTSNWAQKWIVLQDKKSGFYTVRNLGSRLYLTVAGTVKQGASVKQMAKSTSTKQLWQLVKDAGAIQLRSAANPQLSLSVAGDDALTLCLKATKSTDEQRFRLSKVAAIDSGHSFFIRSAANVKKGVAMKGASKKAKAKAVLAKRSSAKTQKFRFKKSGSSYNIQNVRSCMYLGASKKSVVQTKGKKGKAKKWTIALDLASATFSLKSTSTGKYFDTSSGKLALKAGSTTGETTQRFVLVPTYGFTVFVDAGHGRNSSGIGVYDPGAPGSGHNEADLTKDLSARIVKNLAGSDVRAFNGSDYSVPYWQRNAKARSLGCDAVVSIHFDAGGGSSTSTMVGTHGASGSSALNTIIHRKLVSSIGLRDGGTSHRSDITIVNGSVPAVLMEVCFIDNSSALNKYLGRRDAVASAIADGIVAASEKPALQK